MFLSYNEAKKDESAFLSMTSLHIHEFNKLCNVFKEAYEEHFGTNSLDISKPGRPRILDIIGKYLLIDG